MRRQKTRRDETRRDENWIWGIVKQCIEITRKREPPLCDTRGISKVPRIRTNQHHEKQGTYYITEDERKECLAVEGLSLIEGKRVCGT